MKPCVLGFLLVCMAGWTACGGAQSSSGGAMVQVKGGDRGPTLEWDHCTEFGTKKCGTKLKVTALRISPLTCTVGGKRDGERPAMWHISAPKSFGATLTPPIRYGEVPTGAVVTTPAAKLKSGCKYLVVFQRWAAGGKLESFQQTFSW